MSKQNNPTWTCDHDGCRRTGIPYADQFCGGCGGARTAAGPDMSEDANLRVAMFAILRDAQAMTAISEGAAYLTRAAKLATEKARELLCPKVDRDGLAKALRRLAEDAKRSAEGWNTATFQQHVDAIADAAIAYMGARPVESTLC